MSHDLQLQRVMSISHAEFLRSLKPLGRYYLYHIDERGLKIQFVEDNRRIEIRLGEERQKRLGVLILPETTVDFHFYASNPQDIARFFFRFDLCFRRGGG